MAERKIKARDDYVAFAEKSLHQEFGKLNALQQSRALTYFYVNEIHNRLKTEISEEDLDLAIVDGANDLDCDLLHKDDNQVLIIQARYRKLGTKEAPNQISHFQSVLKRIADPNLKANARLLDRLAGVDFEKDFFHLVYVTLGEIDGQARKITEQDPVYPEGYSDIDQRCVWEYLDEFTLNEEYRSALARGRGIPDKTIILYPKGQKGQRGSPSVIEVDAGETRSIIMALDAKQIIGAYQALERDSLFSLNIRNFIGNTDTNKAIVGSARRDPKNFFLFNNGISCLCKTLTLHEDRIEVNGLQVINGAQTVKALVNAGRSWPGQPDPWPQNVPIVLVRITEIPGGYGLAGKLREDITRFNNTQNVVKVSDFRSNDAVQDHLKTQFGELHRRGRRVVYMPKRTDDRPQNSEIIRLEEFSKTVYSFLENPVAFSGSTSFLFDDSETGGYNTIFGDGKAKWERVPDDEFKLRAAIYWLGQAFSVQTKIDREKETDPDAKAALERKWTLIFAARKVLEHYFLGDTWKVQLRKAYKGDWILGEEQRGKWFLKIYGAAKAGVILSYRLSKKHDPQFVHRNWMRNKDTPITIAQNLKDAVLATGDPIGEMPS